MKRRLFLPRLNFPMRRKTAAPFAAEFALIDDLVAVAATTAVLARSRRNAFLTAIAGSLRSAELRAVAGVVNRLAPFRLDH
jgi:hypothetical protein